MPFPSASSYTQTKWLAFFAELTAKLTHSNVLVVMEGAELLKRLLISHVSIAMILQQGELLVRLLDCWRGCVTAGYGQMNAHADTASSTVTVAAAPSAAMALNDELSFVLAESISQCIDLMWSLYADGDAYYCLLVLARAGPMLEVLVDVLQTAPPQLYGITASLLQQLLSLPLGHSDVTMVVDSDGERFVGLDKATLAQVRKSVALRRHLHTLVEAVHEHGALLQHAADVLAGLLAVQQGPRCLAAVYLFNLASKRLRKYELRSGHTTTENSPSPSLARDNVCASRGDVPDPTSDNSELNVTITGAPQAVRPTSLKAKGKTSVPLACALDDLEEGVESSASIEMLSPSVKGAPDAAEAPASVKTEATTENGGKLPSPTSLQTAVNGDRRAPAVEEPKESTKYVAPQDVSALVDAEPVRYACTVPPSLADEALRHLIAASSHTAFFDALDWLWCLTVADAAVVGAALTPAAFTQGLERYLKAAPRTRRDRMLFTLLLLWLGHLHSINALRKDTHRCLLDLAAHWLLPILRTELSKAGGGPSSNGGNGAPQRAARNPVSANASLNVSAITPTENSGASSAMALAASAGYSLPFMRSSLPQSSRGASWIGLDNGGYALYGDSAPPNMGDTTLLPYAVVRKAQEAALLLRPSIEVILFAFLLNIYTGIDAAARKAWVSTGHVLDVALTAVRRAGGLRSVLLDAPGTIDGALSDEVYLDSALRCVRTDVATVAVLGCRLIAAVLGGELRWGPGWRAVHQAKEYMTKHFNGTPDESCTSKTDAAALQADQALFAEVAMPMLVHIAVHNPDVTSAQEGGAASPVHYVPGNLRCTRYTSLGESSLVALDACLQFYAQSGHLRSHGGPAADGGVSGVTIEDLVRVLPALTRVSHSSIHPPIRAIPYRCLLYISQRIEDVLLVLRDMPSLANAAVSCVLDYDATSSQWEVAAAAEWLTVLVDFMAAAEKSAERRASTSVEPTKEKPPPAVETTVVCGEEGTKEKPRRFRFLSPAEQLQEYFHFDDSPLARKLLTSIAAARRHSTGSAYAMSALLQLAVRLQTYVERRERPCNRPENVKAGATADEGITQPLTPAGLSSIAQWIVLLQSASADNARLTRICGAFQQTGGRRTTRAHDGNAEDGKLSSTLYAQTSTAVRRPARLKPVVRGAWARALTAAEQIALQHTFTAALFRALDTLFSQANETFPALYSRQFSNSLVCGAVAATVNLPSPSEVVALLSMRFHAATTVCEEHHMASSSAFHSPALVFGYQAAIQWACCVGARWMCCTYPCCRVTIADLKTPKTSTTPVACGGGLPSPCNAALVEELCRATEAIMRDDAGQLSQRTRCEAAVLLSAVVEMCPVAHLHLLEARGAALFTASTTLRRTPCVSGLQCWLLRRVGSAARYACSDDKHSWLRDQLETLKATIEHIAETSAVSCGGDAPRHSRGARRAHPAKTRDAAAMARDFQAFQVLTSVVTSAVSCVGAAAACDGLAASSIMEDVVSLTPLQRRTLCAILCDALRSVSLRRTVLTALKGMSETAEGRRCLLADISNAGDPLGRTLFGRVLALTLRIPCRWARPNGTTPRNSGVTSPASSPPQPHTHLRRGARSPATTSSRSPHARPKALHDDGTFSGDIMGMDLEVAAGCDLCTSLLGRERVEETATTAECAGGALPASQDTSVAGAAASAPLKASTSSFLAAFVKHRGLEYLAKTIVECDQQQRRQGRPLAVPLPLLRLLAALSLRTSIVKDIVTRNDLFCVVLELAGVAFPPHAATATLAMLTLRNVCFESGLKSTLCQDARVLLTLKAAVLRLSCVSQLVEDTTLTASSSNSNAAPSLGGLRRRRVEVVLRNDVIDAENPAAVSWAKQLCVYAQAQRSEVAADVAAARTQPANVPAAPERRIVFGNVTSASPHPISDTSLFSNEMSNHDSHSGKTTLKGMVATDAEVGRRQYLAATALASLWYDNQRGKTAIMEVLMAPPSCDIDEVQTQSRTLP
jgi:hypothetical protein